MSEKKIQLEERLINLEKEFSRIKEYHKKTIAYQSTDPEASLWMARKVAEAICTQIFIKEISANPKNLTLDRLIGKLNEKQILPKSIIVPLRTIQGYGNFGTHDQGEESEIITSEYVQPCLQSLSTIVEWYFTKYHKGINLPSKKEKPSKIKKYKKKSIILILLLFTVLITNIKPINKYISNIENSNVTNISGKWKLKLVVNSTSHDRYKNMSVEYIIFLQQNGKNIKGIGEKWIVNGKELPKKQHDKITFEGSLSGNNIKLTFELYGKIRKTIGIFNLKKVSHEENFKGVFNTTGANSSGIAVMEKLIN